MALLPCSFFKRIILQLLLSARGYFRLLNVDNVTNIIKIIKTFQIVNCFTAPWLQSNFVLWRSPQGLYNTGFHSFLSRSQVDRKYAENKQLPGVSRAFSALHANADKTLYRRCRQTLSYTNLRNQSLRNGVFRTACSIKKSFR